ncbi:hypothetical protein PG988_001411 [Apiospora saccharicola]
MHFSKLTLSAMVILASIANGTPPPGQDADVQNLVIGDDSGDDFGWLTLRHHSFATASAVATNFRTSIVETERVPRAEAAVTGKPCTVYDFGITGQGAYAICPGHESSEDGV